jgi:deazaflavin-dependent oxidoreductase (nitroreductase family)
MLLKLARRLGRYQWFAGTLRVVLPPVDMLVARLTKGRVVALGLLPSLILTTTGRKSGKPRVHPLVYAPDGETFAVIGSNWGQPNHPAWSGNLLASPDAVVEVKGQVVRVKAELATGAERDRLWAKFVAMWPAYETYAIRAARRELRIFKLVPRP